MVWRLEIPKPAIIGIEEKESSFKGVDSEEEIICLSSPLPVRFRTFARPILV